MIRERLKFYADTPRGEKNKLFCWTVSILSLQEALFRFFSEGYVIRAAWFEMLNTETGETENTRINVQKEFDTFCDLPPKERKRYIKVHH